MRLVWHRGDLRVHDHPALHAALEHGPVVGVVVLDPTILDATSPRRRAWFFHNVRALREVYRRRGGRLLVRHGPPHRVLPMIAAELPIKCVHALASFTPYGIARDRAAMRALRADDVGVRWHDGLYVHSPGTVRTAADGPYSVYTPFLRRWLERGTPDPVPAPDPIDAPDLPASVDPGDIPDGTTPLELPAAGEDAAILALERFVDERLHEYARTRDRLDGRGTSRLSVWITVGALSTRTAAARVEAAAAAGTADPAAARKWLSELAWRDFLADLLFHRPDLLDAPFQPRWAALPRPGGDDRLEAWKEGRTGVPAVDAAMHQLRETGWISNRARMVAAQFLSKQMQVDWRRGEAVFKRWLLDGDTASNVGNWQWAAGLGVDNAPYFRVMNPVTQAAKHDPDGRWIERWAPSSEGRPDADAPIVDPAAGRAAYLEAAEAVSARHADPPPPRRPCFDLATDSQLALVHGIGPTTAGRTLDALAESPHSSMEEFAGSTPTRERIHRRFIMDC